MTKQIMVGGVAVGGGAPVTIQSMCNTKTEDAGATIEQILRLEQAGCEIVRVTVPTPEAAEAGACGKTVPHADSQKYDKIYHSFLHISIAFFIPGVYNRQGCAMGVFCLCAGRAGGCRFLPSG